MLKDTLFEEAPIPCKCLSSNLEIILSLLIVVVDNKTVSLLHIYVLAMVVLMGVVVVVLILLVASPATKVLIEQDCGSSSMWFWHVLPNAVSQQWDR